MLQNIDFLGRIIFSCYYLKNSYCDTQAGNSMTKVDIVRMLSGGGVGV